MRVLDLFSGIGGFALGLERAGFQTVAFCEIEPFCQAVLRKHWPDVPVYDDVRSLTVGRLAADGISVDVICGGFPCTDISLAGTRKGLAGAASGLWREYARLIGELRPSYVIVENTTGLLSLGMGDVLGDLSALGYDAEWEVISASDVGAPHDRERLWLVAYPAVQRRAQVLRNWSWRGTQAPSQWPAAPLDSQRRAAAWVAEAAESIPPFLGDDDGLSPRLVQHQLGAYGNTVIPIIPEIIGRAILNSLHQ